MGIGMVPDATLPGLTRRRGLAVWSEMFSDGVLALDRAGALDPSCARCSSFLFGCAELYAWVHRNPRVRMLRTETTNSPARDRRRNRAMTSINTALQVDLFGQANASRISARIHSGFGGQTDFIVGALHSPGGQALMALRSWHPKADVSTDRPVGRRAGHVLPAHRRGHRARRGRDVRPRRAAAGRRSSSTMPRTRGSARSSGRRPRLSALPEPVHTCGRAGGPMELWTRQICPMSPTTFRVPTRSSWPVSG